MSVLIKSIKKWNLEYIKNSPEDILYATEEMIDRLNNNNFNYLHKNQKEIQNQLNAKQNIYTSEKYIAMVFSPKNF